MIEDNTRTKDETSIDRTTEQKQVDQYLQRLGIPDEEIPRMAQKVVSLRANIEAEILRYREKTQRP